MLISLILNVLYFLKMCPKFSSTFGLANSPRNSANLSCSREVTKIYELVQDLNFIFDN